MQKSLPFDFDAPRLQLRHDKSDARISSQSHGQIIEDDKQHVVKSIGKENKTSCECREAEWEEGKSLPFNFQEEQKSQNTGS